MKEIKKEIKKTIAMSLLIAAFWGIMYPEFSLIKETFVSDSKEYDPDQKFLEMLEGGRHKIVFKSRLWEVLKGEDESK